VERKEEIRNKEEVQSEMVFVYCELFTLTRSCEHDVAASTW
jgi:hypothetical protein